MPKKSFKLPNPSFYFSKLKEMHWIYWALIGLSVSMIVGGLLLFAGRQRQLSENGSVEPTNEETEKGEEEPPPEPGVKPVKIVFKAKPAQYEIAAGAQAEFIAELIGDNNKPYATPDPAFISFSATPDGQNRKVTGEAGGSTFIPAGKSSGKIFMVEERTGTYTLTLAFENVQKDTATLVVKAGDADSITVSGPGNLKNSPASGTYTASAKDKFGNEISGNFNFTIKRSSNTGPTKSCQNEASCTFSDTPPSDKCEYFWIVTATRGTRSSIPLHVTYDKCVSV